MPAVPTKSKLWSNFWNIYIILNNDKLLCTFTLTFILFTFQFTPNAFPLWMCWLNKKRKRFCFWSDKESCKVNIVRVKVQKFCHWVTWLQRIDLARCHSNILEHFHLRKDHKIILKTWSLPMTATEKIHRKSLSRTMATNFQSSLALLFSISSLVKAAMYLTLWIALFSSGHLSPLTSIFPLVSYCLCEGSVLFAVP